jgi:hypothetical protein
MTGRRRGVRPEGNLLRKAGEWQKTQCHDQKRFLPHKPLLRFLVSRVREVIDKK